MLLESFFAPPSFATQSGLPHTPPPALEQAALLFICVPYNSCISRTIWLCFRLLRQMLL